jgi:hypothetical protein
MLLGFPAEGLSQGCSERRGRVTRAGVVDNESIVFFRLGGYGGRRDVTNTEGGRRMEVAVLSGRAPAPILLLGRAFFDA